MKKINKKTIIVITILLVIIALGIFLYNKITEEKSLDIPIKEETKLNVVINEAYKSRYIITEEDNQLKFEDTNYMRTTHLNGYSGTIKKVAISAGCDDDDLFINIIVLTSNGLYGLLLDNDYYQLTKETYSLVKISNDKNIVDIYPNINKDNNFTCKNYIYVKNNDLTISMIEPTACDNNIYCSGDFALINEKK